MFHFTLYGTDIDTTDMTPTIDEVLALTGATSVSVLSYGLDAEPSYEGELTEYVNRFVTSNNKFRMKYKLEIYKRDLPATDKSIAEQYPELSILGKSFLFMYSSDYPVGFETANICIPIALEGLSFEQLSRSMKIMTILLQNRNPLI